MLNIEIMGGREKQGTLILEDGETCMERGGEGGLTRKLKIYFFKAGNIKMLD